jgi:chromosome segregation ATPase
MAESRKQELLEVIQELKEKLRDREAALPVHSVRPHQILEIEELEEKIAAMEKEFQEISNA